MTAERAKELGTSWVVPIIVTFITSSIGAYLGVTKALAEIQADVRIETVERQSADREIGMRVNFIERKMGIGP